MEINELTVLEFIGLIATAAFCAWVIAVVLNIGNSLLNDPQHTCDGDAMWATLQDDNGEYEYKVLSCIRVQ